MAFAYNMGVSDLHDTFTRSLEKPTDLPIMAENLHAWILATPRLVTVQGACANPLNHIYTLAYVCNGRFKSADWSRQWCDLHWRVYLQYFLVKLFNYTIWCVGRSRALNWTSLWYPRCPTISKAVLSVIAFHLYKEFLINHLIRTAWIHCLLLA